MEATGVLSTGPLAGVAAGSAAIEAVGEASAVPRKGVGTGDESLTLPAPPPRVTVGPSEAVEAVTQSLLLSRESFKVALAQISTYPGQIEINTKKIIEQIGKAREAGADLVVFPELAIPSYASMDLFYNPQYVARNLEALQKIKEASVGMRVVVGFVEPVAGQVRPGGRPLLYNSAAVIYDGEIVGVQRKSLLPTYGIFDEDRWFAAATERKVIDAGGIKLGVEICEDLWKDGYGVDPTAELSAQGADLIVNLSASPFHCGKLAVRAGLVQDTSLRHGKTILYTNLVGAFDGYQGEVIFDGRSMVMLPNGKLAGMGKSFAEDLLLVDIARPQELEIPQVELVEELHDSLVMGIRDYFGRLARVKGWAVPKAIIGLSGGIDSALVAALCVEALGPEKVVGVTMPSEYSSAETKGDAFLVAERLGIQCKETPIKKSYKAILEGLREDEEFAALPENVTEENIQARVRMLILMAYANKLGGIMVCTGNKTELNLNNCTIDGDMAGGIGILTDVDKDRVYELSRFINTRAGREVIPVSTIERVPTAELKPGQTDAHVMGAHPTLMAPMCREIFEQGLTLTEALKRFEGRFPEGVIRGAFVKMDDVEWKIRQGPEGFRVTPLAYGRGRQVPKNHGFYE